MLYHDIQIKANTETEDSFSQYEIHRHNSTKLILSTKRSGKILFLGAGNCNDIDLITMIHNFSEVHLLDLDKNALLKGLKRQNININDVYLHIKDITQIIDHYNKILRRSYIYQPDIKRAVELLNRLQFPCIVQLKNNFDVVVSQCIISQITFPITLILNNNIDRKFIETIQSFRDTLIRNHLLEMLNFLKEDGYGIVITDVVSSEAIPELRSIDNIKTLEDILYSCYFRPKSNYYGMNIAGTNILRYIDEYDEFKKLIKLLTPTHFETVKWKWTFSNNKHYIVEASIFQKNPKA